MAATTDAKGQEAVTEDMLADRELEWAALPHTTRKDTLPYLSAREILRLDSAMTNRQERPHLVKAYKGLVSAGFNEVVYADKEDYMGAEVRDSERRQPARLPDRAGGRREEIGRDLGLADGLVR